MADITVTETEVRVVRVEDQLPFLVGEELDCQEHTVGFTQRELEGSGETTIDWRLGNKVKFTFGAFNEVFTFINPTQSCNLLLALIQDGVGSRLAVWPDVIIWAGKTKPALTTDPGGKDLIALYFDGTEYWSMAGLGFGR